MTLQKLFSFRITKSHPLQTASLHRLLKRRERERASNLRRCNSFSRTKSHNDVANASLLVIHFLTERPFYGRNRMPENIRGLCGHHPPPSGISGRVCQPVSIFDRVESALKPKHPPQNVIVEPHPPPWVVVVSVGFSVSLRVDGANLSLSLSFSLSVAVTIGFGCNRPTSPPRLLRSVRGEIVCVWSTHRFRTP